MRTLRFSSIVFCCLVLPAIARSDLIVNGTFDHDLTGWTTSPAVTWTSFDANGSAFSGSALGTNNASVPSTVKVSRGCVPVIPATQVVVSGKIYVPSGQVPGNVDMWAEFNDGPNCTGAFAGYGMALPDVTTFNTWTRTERSFVRPAGAQSLIVELRIAKNVAGSLQAYFDDVYATSAKGDFDLTGKTDVLWRGFNSGAMSAWSMNGLAVGSSVALPTVVGTNWWPVGLEDFQRDGKTDVLWRNSLTGDNVIWFMTGLSDPVAALLPNVPPPWQIVGVGDFQGDGKGDILWRNMTTGANVVWLMDGANIAASAMLPTVANPMVWCPVIADFQGDGKSDILWHHYPTGSNSIWFMDGPNVVFSVALPAVPGDVFIGVGDFQGDGKADILWRNQATGENRLWLMNGPAIAVSAALPPVFGSWSLGLVGDFQGDGKADILWRNQSTGDNSLWLMNGPAVAATATLPNVNSAFNIARGF